MWSGHFEPLLLTFGAVSCALVVLIARRMQVIDGDGPSLLNWRLAVYAPWLAKEIVKANLDVARRILQPQLPISPRIIDVPTSQKSELGQAIYANSITLTPGTVSVVVEGDQILVHALTRAAATGLQTREMDRAVTYWEGRT